jgi:hypothetical protein
MATDEEHDRKSYTQLKETTPRLTKVRAKKPDAQQFANSEMQSKG